jgi:hypothetical protein
MKAATAPNYEKFKVAMRGTSRDEAIYTLVSAMVRDRALKYSTIEELEGSLSPDELARSFDVISVLKLKSLLSEGRHYQAALELRQALEKEPHNVFLQLEFEECLHLCHQYLQSLLLEDTRDPSIEPMYLLLKSESSIGTETESLYVKYLLACKRPKEALECIRPLVRTFPAQRGLRPIVETMVQHIQHPELQDYLRTPTPEPEIECIRMPHSATETRELTQQFKRALRALEPQADISVAQKIVKDTIGDWPKNPIMDPVLKDFYYLKARIEAQLERPLEAVYCLQLYVKMDAANIYARNFLDKCLQDAFVMILNYVRKGEFLDNLCEFYECYSRYAPVPYTLITEVAKQYIRSGQRERGRHLMNNLLSVNPGDSDYLIANLEVALFSETPEWSDSLLNQIHEVYKNRPWDLKLGCLLEDPPTPAGNTEQA